MSVFVIAEAGVNHNGDEATALRMVDVAADAGADAVKFQTFKAEEMVSAAAPKAAYQVANTDADESQLAMLKRLQLSRDAHFKLARRCADKRVRFLSSPFDIGSLDFLVEQMKLETLKIPSGEITNGPLLLRAGESGREIILSTGMSTLEEVAEALGVLAFGMTQKDREPSRRAFGETLDSDAGKATLKERVTLLHCTSQYPAPAADANLRAMQTMRKAFGLRVGYSDHTEGIEVAVAAMALGAQVIEKHFTLDKSLPGPDHKASLEPDELKVMIARIRAGRRAASGVEVALGDGVKVPRPSELDTRNVARKSLVAARNIEKDQVIAAADVAARRPGTGVSPMRFWDLVGSKAQVGYRTADPIGK